MSINTSNGRAAPTADAAATAGQLTETAHAVPRAAPGRRRNRPRALAVAATIALAAAAGVVAVVGPAPDAAAVTGIVYVPGTSSNNTTITKTLFVACPADTRAIGGDIVVNGSNQIRINGIEPRADGVGFEATAPGGGFGIWSFNARAVCAPASSLPNVEYEVRTRRMQATAAAGPVAEQTRAVCDDGQRPIGMGGYVFGENGAADQPRLFLTGIVINGDSTGTVQPPTAIFAGGGHRGFDGVWNLRSTAVCADPLPGIRTGSLTTQTSSDASKSGSATCTGGTVHSAGFDLFSNTPAVIGNVFLTSLRHGGPGSPATVSMTGHESTAGTTSPWSFDFTFICAN